MKKLVLIIGLVLLVGLGALLLYRIDEFNNPPQFKTNEAIQLEKGVPVKVNQVSRRTVTNKLTFTGTIEGIQESHIMPKVGHELKEYYATVGKTVKKGDRLARLDATAIGQQNLKFEQARISYENAKVDLERMKNLLAGGAISQQQYDNAKLNYDLRYRDYLAIADAIYLTTPISGVVVERNGRIGNMVSTGEAMFVVANIEKIRVSIRVSESFINQIKHGQEVEIRGIANQRLMGTVSEVAMAANPKDRSFEVKVEASNSQKLFRPGMSAIVTIITATQENVLSIPKDALKITDQIAMVYLNENGVATQKAITLGAFDGTYYQVLSGLKEQDEFVIQGATNIQKDKQKIIVVK